MAIHPGGAENKASGRTSLLVAGVALAFGYWGFVFGVSVERKGDLQWKLTEAEAKLEKVQAELDVFLKYIAPEIDSIYQMSNDEELTRYFFQYGIRTATPPRLLAAVARVESNYQPGVVSGAGASGVLQVVPHLWGKLVVRKCGDWMRGDARVEICGGAYVLAHYRSVCNGNYHCALSHYYSGGETRVGRQYAANVVSGI